MNIMLRSLMFAGALFTSGCISLLPETAPPKPRYHIEAVDDVSLQGDVLGWSLVVEDPRTTRVYDSVRIAVTPAPGKVEYFAGAQWADRAPRLFQTALVQTFEDSGRILAVGDRSAVPVADIVLQTDIRAMQLNVRGGGRDVEVTVYARIADGKGGVHAARRFKAVESANSEEPDDVVAAFNGAFQSLIVEIAAWTFVEGGRSAAS